MQRWRTRARRWETRAAERRSKRRLRKGERASAQSLQPTALRHNNLDGATAAELPNVPGFGGKAEPNSPVDLVA